MLEENFVIEREGINIYCYYFLPEDKKNIKGIVHIIHGFGEHTLRYKDFAAMLVANGYAVCALDNRGHGKTAVKNQNQNMGHIADENGVSLILEDLHALMEKAKNDFGSSLSYTIFGHSFGSFLARSFAIRYTDEISAMIISATKGKKSVVDNFGHFATKLQKILFGPRRTSNFMHQMSTGGYAKKYFPEDCNNAAWLTSDKSEQLKFLEDQYCLKTPASIATYIEIFNVIDEISKKENINKMRKDLPILIISGDHDVVGDFAKGIDKLYKTYTDIGLTNIVMKIYKGLRHELLNEKDKEMVTEDIINWIKSQAKSAEKGKNIFKDFLDVKKDNAAKNDDDSDKNSADNNLNNNIEENKPEAVIPSVEIQGVIDTTDYNGTSTKDSETKETLPAENETNADENTLAEEDNVKTENVVEETSEKDNNNETTTNEVSDEVSTKVAGKKTAAKKEVAKKGTSKKTTAKKATAKSDTSKKTTAKKATPKKETAKSDTSKKTTAKKATPKKKTAKSDTSKKTTAKKATPKKESAKKETSKKSTAKKASSKKTAE